MKKHFAFFVTIFITATASNIYSQDNMFVPEYSIILSSEKGDKMLKQCSRSVPEKIEKYVELTNEDIQLLESNFKKVLKLKSTECCFSGGQLKTLDDFAFQYTGVIINGKKYIYINAFGIESSEDLKTWYKQWKTEPIVMCDGGDYFWGVLFDLDSQKFSQLAFNGVA